MNYFLAIKQQLSQCALYKHFFSLFPFNSLLILTNYQIRQLKCFNALLFNDLSNSDTQNAKEHILFDNKDYKYGIKMSRQKKKCTSVQRLLEKRKYFKMNMGKFQPNNKIL